MFVPVKYGLQNRRNRHDNMRTTEKLEKKYDESFTCSEEADLATMSADTFGIFTQNRIRLANDTIQHSPQNIIQSNTRI